MINSVPFSSFSPSFFRVSRILNLVIIISVHGCCAITTMHVCVNFYIVSLLCGIVCQWFLRFTNVESCKLDCFFLLFNIQFFTCWAFGFFFFFSSVFTEKIAIKNILIQYSYIRRQCFSGPGICFLVPICCG